MVCAAPLTGKVAGQTAVIVGVELFIVRFTVIVCDLAVTAAPDATIVILPIYGAVCGASVAGFMEIVSGYSSPAVTTSGCPAPLSVVTVSQGAPDVAVNEIGAPLVVMVTTCAAGGIGGATKFRVVELNVRV